MGAWRAAALAAQFGFSVVGSLVGGVAVGLFLDRQFGTAPLFFLLGLFGGLVSSIYLIYLIYRVQVQPARPRSQARAAPGTRRARCASTEASSTGLSEGSSREINDG